MRMASKRSATLVKKGVNMCDPQRDQFNHLGGGLRSPRGGRIDCWVMLVLFRPRGAGRICWCGEPTVGNGGLFSVVPGGTPSNGPQ
jgi:hypothetical protein